MQIANMLLRSNYYETRCARYKGRLRTAFVFTFRVQDSGLGGYLVSSRQAYPCISLSAGEFLGIWCLLTFGISNVSRRLCVIDAGLHFIQPWCLDDAQGCSRGCCLHWPCRVSNALTYRCWLDDCHRYPAVAAGWCQHTRTDILEGHLAPLCLRLDIQALWNKVPASSAPSNACVEENT
jgi:hypothetical protein